MGCPARNEALVLPATSEPQVLGGEAPLSPLQTTCSRARGVQRGPASMPGPWGWNTGLSLVPSLYFLLLCPRLQSQTSTTSAPPKPRLWNKVRKYAVGRLPLLPAPPGCAWHVRLGTILHADSACCSNNAVVAILGSKAN